MARWSSGSGVYAMSANYADDTGADIYNARELQIAAQDFSRYLTRCAAEVAGTAGAAQQFVDKAYAAFGPRLTAAIAGAAYTELSLWEAVGVALATLTAGEVAGILVALGVTLTLLYTAYVCSSSGA
jgi:predicted phage tail protein